MTKMEDARCPICGGEMSFGYGFAGGGLGGYTFCLDCDRLVTKHRTDPGVCLHDVLVGDEKEPGA